MGACTKAALATHAATAARAAIRVHLGPPTSTPPQQRSAMTAAPAAFRAPQPPRVASVRAALRTSIPTPPRPATRAIRATSLRRCRRHAMPAHRAAPTRTRMPPRSARHALLATLQPLPHSSARNVRRACTTTTMTRARHVFSAMSGSTRAEAQPDALTAASAKRISTWTRPASAHSAQPARMHASVLRPAIRVASDAPMQMRTPRHCAISVRAGGSTTRAGASASVMHASLGDTSRRLVAGPWTIASSAPSASSQPTVHRRAPPALRVERTRITMRPHRVLRAPTAPMPAAERRNARSASREQATPTAIRQHPVSSVVRVRSGAKRVV